MNRGHRPHRRSRAREPAHDVDHATQNTRARMHQRKGQRADSGHISGRRREAEYGLTHTRRCATARDHQRTARGSNGCVPQPHREHPDDAGASAHNAQNPVRPRRPRIPADHVGGAANHRRCEVGSGVGNAPTNRTRRVAGLRRNPGVARQLPTPQHVQPTANDAAAASWIATGRWPAIRVWLPEIIEMAVVEAPEESRPPNAYARFLSAATAASEPAWEWRQSSNTEHQRRAWGGSWRFPGALSMSGRDLSDRWWRAKRMPTEATTATSTASASHIHHRRPRGFMRALSQPLVSTRSRCPTGTPPTVAGLARASPVDGDHATRTPHDGSPPSGCAQTAPPPRTDQAPR